VNFASLQSELSSIQRSWIDGSNRRYRVCTSSVRPPQTALAPCYVSRMERSLPPNG
jgi:hypothetical protein